MHLMHIDTSPIDISSIHRYTSNGYIQYIQIHPSCKSLSILSNISWGYIQEKPGMFLRDVPDCDDTGSKSISYKQMKSYELKFSLQAGCRKQSVQTSLVGLSSIYRDPSDEPCRIKCQAHSSISRPITARTGFSKWLKNKCSTIFCVIILAVQIQYVLI